MLSVSTRNAAMMPPWRSIRAVGQGSTPGAGFDTAAGVPYGRATHTGSPSVNRRSEIAFSAEEQRSYIAAARTATLCTHGVNGYPHAVAMWFDVADDGTVWMTTYRKSQKALNARRNPKVALHIESGDTYDTLKGVLIRGDIEVIDDEDAVFRTIMRVHRKMAGAVPDAAGAEDVIRWQARKRVALKITPRRISSWDHSKLGGSY
jgi:PPOX class probable F420-dependent enzyme